MVGATDGDRASLARTLVLINRYSIELTRLASRTLGRTNSANREVQVFLAIARSPGVSPSAIAESLGIDRSSTSRILRRLESESLIMRTRDPDDHRSARLTLTDSGRRRRDAFRNAVDAFFTAQGPLVREALQDEAARPANLNEDGTRDPLERMMRLAAAGSRYTTEVVPAVDALGVSDATERFALCEILLVGEARPSDLVTHLRITSGGVSLLLDRLERAGLVRRDAPGKDADQRRVIVTLTPRGTTAASILLDSFARHRTSIAAALLATVDEGHQAFSSA